MSQSLTEDQKMELAKVLEPDADVDTDSPIPVDVSYSTCFFYISSLCTIFGEKCVFCIVLMNVSQLKWK